MSIAMFWDSPGVAVMCMNVLVVWSVSIQEALLGHEELQIPPRTIPLQAQWLVIVQPVEDAMLRTPHQHVQE
jgi:hypothetical protein